MTVIAPNGFVYEGPVTGTSAPMARQRNRRDLIMGVDFGQAADSTAIAVLEVTESEYQCRHLERLPLGSPYPRQCDRISALHRALCEQGRVGVVADATGVGRAVVDLLRLEVNRVVGLTITGGEAVTWAKRDDVRVPKRELVGVTKVLLQGGYLRIAAGLTEAPTLVRELLAFEAKISLSGHDTYEAWREGEHDDLVLALAMAAWFAENRRQTRLVA